jgi:hypothetical protein
VLNDTVTRGGNPQDGVALSKLMWNRTFNIIGQNVVINPNGDRDADWSLNQMNPDTGSFRVRYFQKSVAIFFKIPMIFFGDLSCRLGFPGRQIFFKKIKFLL